MGRVFAIFDFGKIDFVVFGRNNVDFVKESFVVAVYDSMAVFC